MGACVFALVGVSHARLISKSSIEIVLKFSLERVLPQRVLIKRVKTSKLVIHKRLRKKSTTG